MNLLFNKISKTLLLFIFLYFIFIPIEFLSAWTQTATLELKDYDGQCVAVQNDLPYPSFELQERNYISLNKSWKYKLMKFDHRLSLEEREDIIISQLQNESQGAYEKDFNDSQWRETIIPSVNNPYPSRYQDGTWYRCQFKIDSVYKDKLIKLIFQGANYVTDVWINGHWVGMHEGGYTPFIFNISKYLLWDHDNTLAVRVDNIPWLQDNDTDYTSNDKNIVPYKKCDWWNYGGINRDVYLELSDKVYIVRADIKAQPAENSTADAQIKILIHNSETNNVNIQTKIQVYGTIVNEQNMLSVKASDIMDIKQKINFEGSPQDNTNQITGSSIGAYPLNIELKNIEYWSPQNPKLYVLEVILKKQDKMIDKFYTEFGIRKIAIAEKAQGFTLNGQKIFFNGVARHEDYLNTGKALAFDDGKQIYNDLRFIKDMNANFIRTAHYPNHPLTYLIADRIGLAIMEEIPAFWFSGPGYDIQRLDRGIARQMWEEMIYRDFNRPSILFWSTCNEGGWQDERREFIWDLKQIAYKIDGTRLVGQSASGSDTFDPSHRDCDYLGETLYYGVFDNKIDPYLGTKKAVSEITSYYPNKPLFDTEFGIWSYDNFLLVNEQVRIATNTYKAFREFPQVGGVDWWAAFDWHTMISSPYQSMGTISLDRKYIKPVYFTLQKIYSQSKQGINADIEGVNDKDFVPEILNAQLVIKDNLEKVNSVYYKFFETDFIPIEGEAGVYKLNFNTKKLTERKNYLLFKILMSNGDCFSVKKDIIIADIPYTPVFDINFVENQTIMDKIFLNINTALDQRIASVSYHLDNDEYMNIPVKNSNSYANIIDLKKFKDNSSHVLYIQVKDVQDNKVQKEYKFNIDRSPGIKVDLPYNLDRISYHNNMKDAFEWSLPAEELPDSDSWFIPSGEENIKFYLGPKEDGKNNTLVSLGQTLDVPEGQYHSIYFLGYCYWGNQDNNVILYYNDGTKDTQQISFSDWVGASPIIENEKIGILCTHYHSPEGGGNTKVAVYYNSIKCNPDKTLIKIRLPYDNHKHIFAITLMK